MALRHAFASLGTLFLLTISAPGLGQNISESFGESNIDVYDLESPKYQDPEYTIDELRDKLATYTKLQSTGTKLFVPGLISIGVGATGFAWGIVLLSSGQDEGAFPYMLGYTGVVIGIPLTAAGAVLRGVGGKKRDEYRSRLDRVTLGVGPGQIALTFSY